MKLFVGSLPFELSEDKLKELFENFADVVSVKLITDRETGRSRGFGFVEFSSEDSANKAIEELNGKDVGGRAIIVKKAHDKNERSSSGPRNNTNNNKRRFNNSRY